MEIHVKLCLISIFSLFFLFSITILSYLVILPVSSLNGHVCSSIITDRRSGSGLPLRAVANQRACICSTHVAEIYDRTTKAIILSAAVLVHIAVRISFSAWFVSHQARCMPMVHYIVCRYGLRRFVDKHVWPVKITPVVSMSLLTRCRCGCWSCLSMCRRFAWKITRQPFDVLASMARLCFHLFYQFEIKCRWLNYGVWVV